MIAAVASLRPVAEPRPWPRFVVDAAAWTAASEALASGEVSLLDFWGEAGAVNLALIEQRSSVTILTLSCPGGAFPSVAAQHAPAIRLERTIHDLYGLSAVGATDTRPWLDHGQWAVASPGPARGAAVAPYSFLPAEGESLHQIAVGPVHAGIIEPGHFRFTASGETVVRLEERLGYVHKGIETLMRGKTAADAARLASRTSGDATVAYGFAFAMAVERAVGVAPPPRATALRALMAELERIANHLGDIGAVCNDASFGLLHAHCSVLRERVLRFAGSAFGHRLMMDRIVPGGVSVDLSETAITDLHQLIADIRRDFPRLVSVYDTTASLQDRTVGAGRVSTALARAFATGGHVGRASGREFDARRNLAYPPYERLAFDVPVREEGDVNARVWIRIREVGESLNLIDQLLDLPAGPTLIPLLAEAGEGAAVAESFRGDVLVWVRLASDGTIARCRLRDPSWFQWPLLEAAIDGNVVADFPLCNKSFNCSYSGHDL
jgi:Ni,Fe-hydrogenase III large subunit